MSVKFEGYERRIAKIEKALKEYGIESLEAARDLCLSKGVDVDKIVRGVQPIAFENAVWAYTLGAAIACRFRHPFRIAAFNHLVLHACFSPKSVFVVIRLRQIAVMENILHIIVILKVFQHPVDLFEIILGNIDGV